MSCRDREAQRQQSHRAAEAPPALDDLVCRLLINSDIFVFSKGHFPGSFDLCQNLLSFGFPDVTLTGDPNPFLNFFDGES